MTNFKIPKTPTPVYITGKSDAYYRFEAYNIDDSFDSSGFNSSVLITLKEIKSPKGSLSMSSDLSVSYHAIWNIDDIIDGEYNFMARSLAAESGAKHFFILNWAGSQDKREEILNDIKEGGHYNFEKDEAMAKLFSFKA